MTRGQPGGAGEGCAPLPPGVPCDRDARKAEQAGAPLGRGWVVVQAMNFSEESFRGRGRCQDEVPGSTTQCSPVFG